LTRRTGYEAPHAVFSSITLFPHSKISSRRAIAEVASPLHNINFCHVLYVRLIAVSHSPISKYDMLNQTSSSGNTGYLSKRTSYFIKLNVWYCMWSV